MKLDVIERIDSAIPIYIDIIKYEMPVFAEDMIQPDDVIKPGDQYADQRDTRLFIQYYVKDVAKSIKELQYVQTAYTRKASRNTTRGLSVYLDIVFIHSRGLSKELIDSGYTYTMRFSDHKSDKKTSNFIGYIDLVDRKPKNLTKAAMKLLNDRLSDIQSQIYKFEIDNFGERKTTLR